MQHTNAAPVPYNAKKCPACKKETMETVLRFMRRGPPEEWKQLAKNLLDCITPDQNAGDKKK